MNHTPSARSIARHVDQQSNVLPLSYGCPLVMCGGEGKLIDRQSICNDVSICCILSHINNGLNSYKGPYYHWNFVIGGYLLLKIYLRRTHMTLVDVAGLCHWSIV